MHELPLSACFGLDSGLQAAASVLMIWVVFQGEGVSSGGYEVGAVMMTKRGNLNLLQKVKLSLLEKVKHRPDDGR